MKLLYKCITRALPKARNTAWWIMEYMIPISLIVGLLQLTPFFSYLSKWISPILAYVGLSGEASVAFVSSLFLTLYTPIAIITSLGLDLRQVIILGSMCLISHNLVFETTVQKKTGSSAWKILLLRLMSSVFIAFLLHAILPENLATEKIAFSVSNISQQMTIEEFFGVWIKDTVILSLKIFLIIFALNILQNILKETGLLKLLSHICSPLMLAMALPRNCSFLWVVGQTLGLTYGAGVLMEEIKNKTVDEEEAIYLNYHLALNHSQIEDTALFVAIGVPYLWAAFPRLILAVVVLWIIRIVNILRQK